MNDDIYKLLPPEECYSKTHGKNFFETYNSHVNLCLAFVDPVLKILNPRNPDDIKKMIQFHDLGKLGPEFQKKIKGGKEPQYIHHSEVAFMKWLNKDNLLKDLKLPHILAILAHHRTLIDEESAIIIEQYISNHSNWKILSKKWLNILKRETPDRIDKEFLLALPLIDILRTIDILASFTSEIIFKQYMKEKYVPNSLFESGFTDVSKELSSINIRLDELKYDVISDDGKNIKIHLNFPINSEIEYVRRD